MIDPKLLRSDLEATAQALRRRGFELDTVTYADLEEQRKQYQKTMEDLRSLRELESLSANKLAAMERDVEWIKLALRADGHGEA